MESVSDNVAIINQQRNLGNMTGGRDARNFMVMKRLEALEESRLLRKAEKEAKAAAGGKSGGRFPLSRPKSVMDISSIAVLAQLKAKSIKLVNIGAEDLASGDQKLVLGLTWTLILRYEIHRFGGNEAELLTWTKDLAETHGVSVDGGWANGFSSGHAFCAIGARLSLRR